jgi:hypothetical protein
MVLVAGGRRKGRRVSGWKSFVYNRNVYNRFVYTSVVYRLYRPEKGLQLYKIIRVWIYRSKNVLSAFVFAEEI